MPALLADGNGVLSQMLKMLELNVCLCHGVSAPWRTQVIGARNGCRLQVAGCINTSCIVCLLQIYLSCTFAVQTRCLRKFSPAAFVVSAVAVA
jgi:hypothetical protein